MLLLHDASLRDVLFANFTDSHIENGDLNLLLLQKFKQSLQRAQSAGLDVNASWFFLKVIQDAFLKWWALGRRSNMSGSFPNCTTTMTEHRRIVGSMPIELAVIVMFEYV